MPSHTFSVKFDVKYFFSFIFIFVILCLEEALAGLRAYSIRQSVTPHVSFLCHNLIYFVLLAAMNQELNLIQKESKWVNKWHYIMTSYSWSLSCCCY